MKHSTQNVLATFLVLLTIVVVGLVIVSATATIAKNDKASEKSNKSDKSLKENSSQKTKDLTVKNEQKEEKVNSKTQEQGVAEDDSSDEVAKIEKVKKQEKIAQQVGAIVEENEENSQEIADTIEEVEGRNKFKTFLVGTDYKNLGQLRSSLVHNRNQIRKLTQSMEGASPEDQAQIEAQLMMLVQEREQIKTVITNNEEGFSLLGWAFRLINGYEKATVDENDDADLLEDVEDAINSANEDVADANDDISGGEEQENGEAEDVM